MPSMKNTYDEFFTTLHFGNGLITKIHIDITKLTVFALLVR